MVQLIEGTHYRRREYQPSLAPHKSKEVVDCLLCSDPGDDDDAHGGQTRRKRSRPIGINIRMDRFIAHIRIILIGLINHLTVAVLGPHYLDDVML